MNKLLLLLVVWLAASSAWPQASGSQQKPACTPDQCALNLIIAQVKVALDQYQKSLGGGPDALPPLFSAEFDFKVTTGTTVGGSVNLFIFKFGASHERDVVNDVTYTYAVPPPQKVAGVASAGKPPTLTEALASAIQSAAAAVKTSGTVGNLQFKQLAVNLQYGVKWDVNGGITAPISFVTVGLNGDKNKNTIQSVKLTFNKPTANP
jgi:hypothetical protein